MDCQQMLHSLIKALIVKVVKQRICDPHEWTRRLVLEGLTNLEATELKTASQVDMKTLEVVFDALRDDETSVQKLSLSLLHQILTK